MDERERAQAGFALRMAADLLTALVVTDVLPKRQATALVDDALRALLDGDAPDLAGHFRQIAAALTAQIELVAADLDRRIRDD